MDFFVPTAFSGMLLLRPSVSLLRQYLLIALEKSGMLLNHRFTQFYNVVISFLPCSFSFMNLPMWQVALVVWTLQEWGLQGEESLKHVLFSLPVNEDFFLLLQL